MDSVNSRRRSSDNYVRVDDTYRDFKSSPKEPTEGMFQEVAFFMYFSCRISLPKPVIEFQALLFLSSFINGERKLRNLAKH